ncbi:lysophospholipid acyltransferase family protein [Bacillus sp. J33]|uniref:lysophospholipid acyltransferase family protein n=1 Tax=Bacillus sp. J33 TaxID=935836 RepID=UPI00047B4C63|nr:lysophospholipid acyltransferase family protein [Bacillus sp. J33]
MLHSILKPVVKLLMLLKFRIQIIGLENIPSNTPLIVAAKHVSNYDPILLSCMFDWKNHFMAKAELFCNFFSKWFFTNVYAFPVDRQSGIAIRPIRRALAIIKTGDVFGIFPEGKRCKNGEIVQPKKGVAFIASKTNAPILPIAIIGINKGIRSPLKIVIGPQVNVCQLDNSDYSSLSRYVMDRIKDLEKMHSMNS